MSTTQFIVKKGVSPTSPSGKSPSKDADGYILAIPWSVDDYWALPGFRFAAKLPKVLRQRLLDGQPWTPPKYESPAKGPGSPRSRASKFLRGLFEAMPHVHKHKIAYHDDNRRFFHEVGDLVHLAATDCKELSEFYVEARRAYHRTRRPSERAISNINKLVDKWITVIESMGKSPQQSAPQASSSPASVLTPKTSSSTSSVQASPNQKENVPMTPTNRKRKGSVLEKEQPKRAYIVIEDGTPATNKLADLEKQPDSTQSKAPAPTQTIARDNNPIDNDVGIIGSIVKTPEKPYIKQLKAQIAAQDARIRALEQQQSQSIAGNAQVTQDWVKSEIGTLEEFLLEQNKKQDVLTFRLKGQQYRQGKMVEGIVERFQAIIQADIQRLRNEVNSHVANIASQAATIEAQGKTIEEQGKLIKEQAKLHDEHRSKISGIGEKVDEIDDELILIDREGGQAARSPPRYGGHLALSS